MLKIINLFFIPFYYILFRILCFLGKYNIDSYNSYVVNSKFSGYLKEGNASKYAIAITEKYCIGNGLDIGCGKWPIKNSRGIENAIDENAYSIIEDDLSQDFIFSSHLLEHLSDPYSALIHWTGKIKVNGHLILYLPHPSCELWDPKYLKWHINLLNPYQIENFLNKINKYEILYITYLPDAYFSYVVVAKKITK